MEARSTDSQRQTHIASTGFVTMNANKPLEQCSLPELAQRLADDPRRQDFYSIWNDEAEGIVHDAVQMLRARIDTRAGLDDTDELGQTALDILVDPKHYTSTDPATVLALLQAGARTSKHVLGYLPSRLYAENTLYTALMFHARAQSDKPLSAPGMGNYYHSLIDAEYYNFVLIAPMLDQRMRYDSNTNMSDEEIALLAGWLFETRDFDGNTPVMLAWDQMDGHVFPSAEYAQQFEEFSLPELWKLTARYLNQGGDLTQKNHQGRSILSNIFKHDPDLNSKVWSNENINDAFISQLRAHLAALSIQQNTPEASFKIARVRI